ncbi:hypothetical protein [Kitasatospora sp. GP82]|uniref:hypothetical protein n=1 Tax=Kitasatospora sp. GP82 TaxID=3035089 RepID=UPI0024745C71|nr:hypothetical protein [Kitasatospora sp. GP82]MDH6126867.1 hypothetical protein [Kitasatospora sp. GP82]
MSSGAILCRAPLRREARPGRLRLRRLAGQQVGLLEPLGLVGLARQPGNLDEPGPA